jgi:hypothetical protein
MSLENAAGSSMDFMKNMWGNMGMSLPGMITPTFDVEEIEKRVKDLKAVEGWLKMNLTTLQITIQGLEMQCATLTAVKAMGEMASQAGSAKPEAASGDSAAQAAMWPWTIMQQMQEKMQEQLQQTLVEQPATEASKAANKRSGK